MTGQLYIDIVHASCHGMGNSLHDILCLKLPRLRSNSAGALHMTYSHAEPERHEDTNCLGNPRTVLSSKSCLYIQQLVQQWTSTDNADNEGVACYAESLTAAGKTPGFVVTGQKHAR